MTPLGRSSCRNSNDGCGENPIAGSQSLPVANVSTSSSVTDDVLRAATGYKECIIYSKSSQYCVTLFKSRRMTSILTKLLLKKNN